MVISSMSGGTEDLVLQCVITCVNYSDFLKYSLPNNLCHFDRIIVVTDFDDKQTYEFCRSISIPCIKTDEFYVGNDSFNKGRGINMGLAHLIPGGWILHMDADIVLPPNFRRMLRYHPLQKDCVYGVDRINVFGIETWDNLKEHLFKQYNYNYMVTPFNDKGTKLGSRFVHNEWGYCPIGFFQLWHSSMQLRYPINQGTAEHTDVTFAMQFKNENRKLIPELFVYHLENEENQMGQNWGGRVSKEFGRKNDTNKSTTALDKSFCCYTK